MKLLGTSKSSTSVAGFTLIELMLVMALTVIIGVTTSSVGVSYYQSHVLAETTDNLVSTLRQAQGFSMSGKNNHTFGVYITEDSYIFYEGESYESRAVEEDLIFLLNRNITITGPREIHFSSLSGTPNTIDTLYIALNSREKEINILPSGYIGK